MLHTFDDLQIKVFCLREV